MIYMTPPDLSELFSKALSDAKVRLSRPKIQKRLRGKEIWEDTPKEIRIFGNRKTKYLK